MYKENLRKQIRETKRQFTPQQFEEMSFPIIERIRKKLKGVQVVLAYYSLPDEVSTHQLIDELVAEGKTILLPKVTSNDAMELCCYTGRNDLQEGYFHIKEPVGEIFTAYDEIDLALIPGMAFDSRGNRLGRGCGYYDRFLVQMPQIRKIGVCFDFQKVPEVPVDCYDIAVNEVV